MQDMDRQGGDAKFFSEWKGWLEAGFGWVLPGQSLASRLPLPRGGGFSIAEFADLDFLQPPFCACCSFPFEMNEGDGALCAGCLANKPVFTSMRAPLIYSDLSADLVLGLKRQGRRTGLRLYGKLMYAAAMDVIDSADCLVPVPLHFRRLASRGFNQSGWLASTIAREARLPVRHDTLIRRKAAPSQGHLSPRQRRANVAGAFEVRSTRRAHVEGKRVVIVDDVYTTGATVEACARALYRAKAANVDVVTLARVVAPKKSII